MYYCMYCTWLIIVISTVFCTVTGITEITIEITEITMEIPEITSRGGVGVMFGVVGLVGVSKGG